MMGYSFINLICTLYMFTSLAFQRYQLSPRKSLTTVFLSSDNNIPDSKSDYQFLDCGNNRRLERFGDILVSRSCPTASNRPTLSAQYWDKAQLIYSGQSGKVGEWAGLKYVPKSWYVQFHSSIFSLTTSAQGQVGIFPEQQENWSWIRNQLNNRVLNDRGKGRHDPLLRVLNGFAYTGGSTMAAASVAGVTQVVHLDAAKSAVQWAVRNVGLMNSTLTQTSTVLGAELIPPRTGKPSTTVYNPSTSFENETVNTGRETTATTTTTNSTPDLSTLITSSSPNSSTTNIAPIRWIVDDCMTFLDREIRRGSKYEAIILDPPAFGRSGSKLWKLENDLSVLVSLLPNLLSDRPLFVLLSCHDPAWSSDRLAMLLGQYMELCGPGIIDAGEMVLRPSVSDSLVAGYPLSCGVYARWIAKAD